MQCSKCQIEKPEDQFPVHQGYRSHRCIECRRAYLRAYAKEYKEKHGRSLYTKSEHSETAKAKARERVRRYHKTHREQIAKNGRAKNYRRKGITIEQYDAMFASQDGLCAICRKSCTMNKHLCVDHNHQTGVVRGLLYWRCNVAIGKFEDNPHLLRQAAAYLEK